jgi:hypothetical protein
VQYGTQGSIKNVSLKDESKKNLELSKLFVELEWRRCAEDEAYFLSNYVYIPAEKDIRGRVKFDLFDYQHDLLQKIKQNRFIIALKARQLGYTTLAMAHSLWLAFFRPGATILLVSRNQKSSNKNLAQARLAYQFLPQWMKARAPKLISDSTDGMSFQFADGMVSKLKAAAAVEGVFAGETATLVVLDEAALIDPDTRQEDVFRTLLPTTDAGGSMIIISTSRGGYNRFAKTYKLAKKNESQFIHFFRPWQVSPFMQCSSDCDWCSGIKGSKSPCNTKYDLKRREFADEPWRFYQEYPSDDEEAFRESGRPRFVGLPGEETFIDFPYRGNLVWKDESTIEFEFNESGPLRLNNLDNDPNAFYVIGADPASGQGRDYSTAHLLIKTEDDKLEIVGYYHSNTTPPTEFAADLDKLGRYFKGRKWAALLAIENQGSQGSLPINELHKHLNYPNAYFHQGVGTKNKNRNRLFEFPMTVDKRKAVIDRLGKHLVYTENECNINNIYPLLRMELGQFVTQETANGNIRYAADVGCHDDLVMSLAISVWVLTEEFGDFSPQSAIIEDSSIRPVPRFSIKSMREERERMIQQMEEDTQRQWETFGFNTGL